MYFRSPAHAEPDTQGTLGNDLLVTDGAGEIDSPTSIAYVDVF